MNPTPLWIEKVAARIRTLTAWKDGQGDIRRYQQIMKQVGERLYWIGGGGDDCVPGYYSVGIRTYTSSIATVAPKLSLMLHEVASIPDPAKMSQLMNNYVTPLYALRSRRKGYEVPIMKEMMNQLGMAAGPVRPPLPQVTAEDKKLVRQMLENWSPVLPSDVLNANFPPQPILGK